MGWDRGGAVIEVWGGGRGNEDKFGRGLAHAQAFYYTSDRRKKGGGQFARSLPKGVGHTGAASARG